MITLSERGDLFTMVARGEIARAHLNANVAPSNKHMAIIHGKEEPTLRDLADVGHITGYVPMMTFSAMSSNEDAG